MVQLHGFSQSGNTFKVAFLLRALGQAWEPRFVDFMNGVTRSGEWRDSTNEMGVRCRCWTMVTGASRSRV